MNTIFQIAGIGIVVAFLVTVLEQMGKKITRIGLPSSVLFIFYLWLLQLWRTYFKNQIGFFISRVEG